MIIFFIFIDSPLAKKLLENSKRRFENITDNVLFKSAILLDPRFNMELSIEDKNQAIDFLMSLHSRILKLGQECEPVNVVPAPAPQQNDNNDDEQSQGK